MIFKKLNENNEIKMSDSYISNLTNSELNVVEKQESFNTTFLKTIKTPVKLLEK